MRRNYFQSIGATNYFFTVFVYLERELKNIDIDVAIAYYKNLEANSEVGASEANRESTELIDYVFNKNQIVDFLPGFKQKSKNWPVEDKVQVIDTVYCWAKLSLLFNYYGSDLKDDIKAYIESELISLYKELAEKIGHIDSAECIYYILNKLVAKLNITRETGLSKTYELFLQKALERSIDCLYAYHISATQYNTFTELQKFLSDHDRRLNESGFNKSLNLNTLLAKQMALVDSVATYKTKVITFHWLLDFFQNVNQASLDEGSGDVLRQEHIRWIKTTHQHLLHLHQNRPRSTLLAISDRIGQVSGYVNQRPNLRDLIYFIPVLLMLAAIVFRCLKMYYSFDAIALQNRQDEINAQLDDVGNEDHLLLQELSVVNLQHQEIMSLIHLHRLLSTLGSLGFAALGTIALALIKWPLISPWIEAVQPPRALPNWFNQLKQRLELDSAEFETDVEEIETGPEEKSGLCHRNTRSRGQAAG